MFIAACLLGLSRTRWTRILFLIVISTCAIVSGQETSSQAKTINLKKEEDTLKQLLLKRRIALRQHVAAVQAAFEDDSSIQFIDVLNAHRLLLGAELELCGSPEERVVVHEKLVEIYKDHEMRIEKLSNAGRRGGEAEKHSFAVAARLEAEIALQRERMSIKAQPANQ